jgi:hypothetical protein
MKKGKSRRIGWLIFQVFWVLACVYVLVRSLIYQNADAQEFEFFTLLVLAYPMSLVAMWGYAWLLNWIPSEGPAGILLLWCFFFAVGCFQWFAVIPFLARRLRRFRAERVPVSVVPKG